MAKPGLTKKSDAACVVGLESFTMSRPIKRLILTSTVNNWKDYVKQSRESDQNWSIAKASSSRQRQALLIFDDPFKLKEIGWEVLMHPPYSLDLAPSDYYLFRSLQNSLSGVKLISKEACENHLSQFFAQKSQKFYSNGIMVLSQKWQKMVKKWHIFDLINFI